jgi:hypothetical protein
LLALASLFLVAMACGGDDANLDEEGNPNVADAPADGAATPAPSAPPDDGMPPLVCPEESMYQLIEDPSGLTQSCDIAGVQHGPFRRWYSKDHKEVEGAYEMGQPDGTWTWRFEDSSKKSKGAYKVGKQVGAWTWWHPNGIAAEAGDYLQGRKAGQWTVSYPSALIHNQGMYHNGAKNGTWVFKRDDTTNSLSRKEVWHAGRLTTTEWYDVKGTKLDAPPEGEEASEAQ